MSLKIVQLGSGATRPLAIMYLVGDQAGKLAAEIGPEACVVSETAPKYNIHGQGGVTPWSDVVSQVESQDSFMVGDIWLIGFSAGCQGVRTQLNNGCPARYILASDGIHMPLGTPSPEQKDSWLSAASRARSGDVVFSVSCSNTGATEFKPTRKSAEELFGVQPCFGTQDAPCVVQQGEFRVYGATTSPMDPVLEHMGQLRVLLPIMIREAKGASGNWPWYALAMVAGAILGWFW